MRAIVCSQFGALSNLAVIEVPPPRPKAREVVVRVAAAGLNFADALMAQGKYQGKPRLPYSPGMELAGTVAEIGPEVQEFRVGEPVMAIVGYGAFAELCLVPIERVMRRPEALPAHVAAAALITYGTAVHALRHRARLEPGETVLILGAAGGAGTAAVEVAKLLGARVIAVASSAQKLDLCRTLRADDVVNYANDDLRERLEVLTGGRGVDVVYDPVGGSHAEVALRATAWGGRHLVIGFAAGDIPTIPLNLALLNERTILGVFLGGWAQRNRRAAGEMYEEITRWIADGCLSPVITSRLTLEEIPRGLEDLTSRRVVGKTVAIID